MDQLKTRFHASAARPVLQNSVNRPLTDEPGWAAGIYALSAMGTLAPARLGRYIRCVRAAIDIVEAVRAGRQRV
jgi:hypothetical protein